MRVLASTVLAAAAMLAAAIPARAQTYDPSYPVCLQTYDEGGGYLACEYTSLAQCNATASSRGAACVVNPDFAQAKGEAQGRALRHPRRVN